MRKHEKPKAVETGGNGAQPEQPRPIAEMSLEQLKAAAFDRIALIQKAQADLQMLQGEIARRG